MLQVQKNTYASTASATTHTVTYNSTPTQNNLLIMCVSSDDTVNTPTGWSLAVTNVDFASIYIFYKIAGASESTSISVSCATISDSLTAVVFEYSGMTASPFDQSASAIGQGNPSTISTGTTATTAQANELAIAAIGLSNNPTATVSSWSNGFTTEASVISTASSINIRIAVGSCVLSSTGTETSTATLAGNGSGHDVGAIATFKIAASVLASTIVGIINIVGITKITF